METESLTFPHLRSVLDKYGKKAQEVYKGKLVDRGKNASKDLYNSVKFQVKEGGNTYEVGLNLAYYWKFVEGGTKGRKYPKALCRQHFPPVDAIENWIEVKPVIPRPMKNGKLPTQRQLAYLIARGISINGIAPAPMLEETSNEVYKEFEKELIEAFSKDVQGVMVMSLSAFKGL